MAFFILMQVFTISDVFASPAFNRQEVKDLVNDLDIKNTGADGMLISAPDGQTLQITNAVSIEECKDENGNFISPDIAAVSYLSDGKTLDVTLWLSSAFRDPATSDSLWTVESLKEVPWHNVGYTISIDIISAYDTGPDYYATIKWDPAEQKWTRVLEEGSGTGEKRTIQQDEATGFYDSRKNYVLFSIPLEKIGSPQQYNILLSMYDVFIKNDQLCYLVDIGNWVQVPPPEFLITTTPNPILLRPGEQASAEVQVKSLTNVKSNVHLAMDSVDGLKISLPSSEAYVPPLGIGTLLLEVTTTDNVKYRTYTIPVYANHTFLTVSKLRGGEYVHNQVSTSTLDISNFIISVSPPLTTEERFSKFWSTYGTVISIVASAAVSVVFAPIVKKRIDERKKDSLAKDDKGKTT